MGSVLSSYSPSILVDIYLTATHRFATRDFYDASGNYYKGSLKLTPGIERELSDLYYGVQPGSSLTLQFSNRDNVIDDTWDEIIAGEEIRGEWIKIQRHDPTDGTSFEFRGKITEYVLGDIVSITIEMRDDEILDTLLPLKVVTTDEFTTTALDLGEPINICFGRCRNVLLRNIQNNTDSNYYDYLIGYSTVESLWVDHANGKGVKRDGVLVTASEYTFYDGSQGSPFSGYAFIRFTTEQRNFSGGFHNLTADIYGLELGGASANRNFATCIKYLLNDATWGLNDNVDATSFSTAATAIDNIGNMYCDGAITDQKQARDVLNDLLFPARANIERAADGEWEITVDEAGSSVANFGDNDGFYNNCEILEVTATPARTALKKAIAHYDLDPYNEEIPYKEMFVSVHSGFGVERTYDLSFVRNNLTAERVLSYLKNRSIHSDERVKIRAGMEARDRAIGEIITLTAPRRSISAKEYKIDRIVKDFVPAPKFILDCREYSSSIYDNETLTKPTSPDSSDKTVTGPETWVGPITLGDGANQSAQVTLMPPAGLGDIWIAAKNTGATFDWPNWRVDGGFMLGLDDSDADKTKFFIGDSGNYYFMWDGTAPLIKAANFELDASGNITVSNITATGGTIGGWTIAANKISITGIELDQANNRIRAYTGSNYVDLTAGGLTGYDSVLGTVFRIFTDGSAPEFSSGIIKECVYEIYTSGVIKTAADPTATGGLIINTTSLRGYDDTPTKLLEFVYSGAGKGDAYIGDYDNSNHGLKYDHSAGLLSYRGLLEIIGDSSLQNMLMNGGFEETDGTDAYYWESGSGFETITTGGDGSNKYRKITRSGTDKHSYHRNPDGTARKFEVNEGEIYEIGGSLKSDGTCTAQLILQSYDKDKAYVSNTETSTASAIWTDKSVTYTIPSGVKFLNVLCGAITADGWAAFDNVYLKRIDEKAWSFTHASDRTKIDGGNIYVGSSIGIGSATWQADGIQLQYNAGNPRFYCGDGSNKYVQFDGTDITLGPQVSLGINSATWQADGIQLQYNAGNPRFYCGDGSNNFFQFDGTNVTISTSVADAIVIKSGADIKIEDGGDINLLAGGDIVMTPSDSNPSNIKFGTLFNIGSSATAAYGLCFCPATTGVGQLRFGYNVAGVTQPFSKIQGRAEDYIDWRIAVTSPTRIASCYIGYDYTELHHSNSDYSTCKIRIDGAANSIQLNTSANGLIRPGSVADATDLGNATHYWNNVYAVTYKGTLSNDGAYIQARSANRVSFNWTGSQLDFYVDAANVKTFVIQHPVDSEKYLVHATLEGPEACVFYRGTAKLKGGYAEIVLPEYFEALTEHDGRTIILTMIDRLDKMMIEKQAGQKIKNGKFNVRSENPYSEQEFDWEVKAIRKDVTHLLTEPYKKDCIVKGQGPYTYI